MKILGWDELTQTEQDDAAWMGSVTHSERRGHSILRSQDGSWLCGNCESSFNMKTGEMILTDVTLDDLKRIKEDVSRRTD